MNKKRFKAFFFNYSEGLEDRHDFNQGTKER